MKYLSKIISARLAVERDKKVTGIQTFNQSFTDIGVLFDSNFPKTIKPAADHIGKLFAQNQTQNTKAHHKIFTHQIPLACNNQTTGIIATAIGTFPIKAEMIADHHSKINAVNSIFS
jgi:hypothetical protein